MTPAERATLLAFDAGPYHARAVRTLSARQRAIALQLAACGLARLMPRRGRMPRRYVVTCNGSHALGTFAAARDLDAEIARR